MDDDEITRLEGLVRALDEVLEFHEHGRGAPAGLLEELRGNRARLVLRLTSPTAVTPGDAALSDEGRAGQATDHVAPGSRPG
jgi:hypothetical protein